MDDLKYDNSLIIAPREYFEYFYDYRRKNPLDSFKLLTLEDAIDLFTYQFDDRAQIYLIKKGYTYSLASDVLNSLKFVFAHSYKSKKLNDLVKIRDELLKEKLIWKNEYAAKEFENKKIIVAGYKSVKELNFLLKDKEFIYIEINHDEQENKCAIFDNIYSEVHYVMYKICELLKAGTDINTIYIAGVNDEYENILKDFSKIYGFCIDIAPKGKLLQTSLCRDFIKKYNASDLQKAIEFIKNKYSDNLNLSLVVDNAQKYTIDGLTKVDQINLYRDVFSSYIEKHESLINSVHILNNYKSPLNSHVIFVNFALTNAPVLSDDTDYLSDKEKEELGVFTSSKNNEIKLNELISLMGSSNICSVSRSTFLKGRGQLFDSPLIQIGTVSNVDMNIKEEKEKYFDLKTEYSKEFGKYWGMSLVDDLNNLRIRTKITKQLMDEYNLGHRTYENEYKFVPFKCVDEKQVMTYSFSSMNEFYECPFKYYCDHILDLGEFKPNFAATIGNIFHGTLEYLEKGKDFDIAWDDAFARENEKYSFSPKELFLVESLKEELFEFSKILDEFSKSTQNKKVITEVSLNCDVNDSKTIKATGRIDKIILSGPEENLAIVDYKKKNHDKFIPEFFEYGLCLQLPFYVYLIKNGVDLKNRSYSDKEIIGLFIQQVLRDSKVCDKDVDSQRRSDTRLDGIYTDNTDKLSTLCSLECLENYLVSSKNRQHDKDYILGLAEIVKEKILNMDKEIREGNFEIKPKDYSSSKSCEYCSYRSICYRRQYKVVYVEKPEKKEETKHDA